METIPEGEAVNTLQKMIVPEVLIHRDLFVSDPWDSGIDSDDSPPPDVPENENAYPPGMSIDTLFRRMLGSDFERYFPPNGRSSPPLDEVELTASDEDDDTSVLELVIPMQSRYQRVPTSSPKKPKPKKRSLFAYLLCCMGLHK